jgi:hypothetical protein
VAKSQLYTPAREKFATALLNWNTGVIRAVFLVDAYVADMDDEFLSDISASVRVSVSMPVTGRAATKGVCSGDPIRFPLLFDTRFVSHVAIFKDTAVESTSPLIAYLGKDDIVNSPFKPAGLDYFIYPNIVDKGFFRL